jgi:hypothetical protein
VKLLIEFILVWFDVGKLILKVSKKFFSFFLSSVDPAVVPSVSLFTPSDGNVLSSDISEFPFD